MAALAMACPSFSDALLRHRTERKDIDEPDSYLGMAAFAEHLVDLLEANEVAEFPAVFAAVEDLLADSDPGVRYLVTVGLLEDIGNLAANTHGWPWAARFMRWFGPLASQAWNDLHAMWGTSDGG